MTHKFIILEKILRIKILMRKSSTAHLFMACLALILFDQLSKVKSSIRNAGKRERETKIKSSSMHFCVMYVHMRVRKLLNNVSSVTLRVSNVFVCRIFHTRQLLAEHIHSE
jgi:hypothetical protein